MNARKLSSPTSSSSSSTAMSSSSPTSSSTSSSVPTASPGGGSVAWPHRSRWTFRIHWIATLAVLCIWALALVRVLVDPTPRLPLVFNWTPSVPYHVALAHYEPGTLHRGDYILFRFDGQEQLRHPGLRDQPFFKQIAGLPGDVVQVHGRVVTVNGKSVGTAKTHTFDRQPLATIDSGVIPPGHYFVQGASADSFDSRYRSSGLVRDDQVIALLTPIF
jgi:conjugal transfer pilin signal peptidase TrbI